MEDCFSVGDRFPMPIQTCSLISTKTLSYVVGASKFGREGTFNRTKLPHLLLWLCRAHCSWRFIISISGFAVSEGRSGTVHSYITEPRSRKLEVIREVHRLLVNNKFRKSSGKRVPGRACELAGDDVDRQLSYVPSPREALFLA